MKRKTNERGELDLLERTLEEFGDKSPEYRAHLQKVIKAKALDERNKEKKERS